MLYDAILNGARSIAFYGGNNPNCWTTTDGQFGWNWSFWSSVLKPLLGEINSLSPLAPALVNPATTQTLPASDATTQAISRQGNSGDLWVHCGPPRRGHGARDDRRDSRSGFHGHRLHRGTVDHRLQRLVHRRLLAVGRARLPLRSRRTAAAAAHAPAVLRRRGVGLISSPPGLACRERQGRRPSRPDAHRGEQGRSRAGCRRNGVAFGERHDLGVAADAARLRCRPSVRLRPRLPRSTRTVRLAATVTGPGPVVITAAARARQTDTNPADNDATLRIEPAAALSPSPPSSGAKAARRRYAEAPPAGHTPRHERAGRPVRARRPRRPLRLQRP